MMAGVHWRLLRRFRANSEAQVDYEQLVDTLDQRDARTCDRGTVDVPIRTGRRRGRPRVDFLRGPGIRGEGAMAPSREMVRCAYDSRTFSARGPLGPCPVWNVTACPSRSESNDWHAD